MTWEPLWTNTPWTPHLLSQRCWHEWDRSPNYIFLSRFFERGVGLTSCVQLYTQWPFYACPGLITADLDWERSGAESSLMTNCTRQETSCKIPRPRPLLYVRSWVVEWRVVKGSWTVRKTDRWHGRAIHSVCVCCNMNGKWHQLRCDTQRIASHSLKYRSKRQFA